MPAKKLSDETKVMDVSRPGKGKIITTSRPVVAPVVNEGEPQTSASLVPDTEASQPLAPSAGKKVIQPLNADLEVKASDTLTEVSVEPTTAADEAAPAPATEAVPPVSPDPTPAEPNPVKESIPAKPAVPKASDPALPEPKAPEKPADTGEPIPKEGESDAAGVDALAEAATAKKDAAKKAEEQAQRDAAIQELIDTKKYFVPIGHGGHAGSTGGKNNLAAILILFLLVALAVGYVLVDMGKIGSNISLPYEFFKDEKTEDITTSSQPVNSETENTEPEITPTAAAEDDERRNELKNLQVKLEAYYADKAVYPGALNELAPVPTQDELTGPDGDAYTYTPAKDESNYTLTTMLSSGEYRLTSINQ